MLWLIFPAYNEKKNLIKLLPELSGFLRDKAGDYTILIINDGSTDSTKNIAECFDKPLPIKIVSHEKNKGVGEVFKTAFSVIEGVSDDDLAIVLEADGTSDYTLIPKLVEKLQSGSDIVIASRYIKGGAYKNFPLKRHMISLGGNIVLRVLFRNKNISDYTIFFRGYKTRLIKKALSVYKDRFITSKTFLANTEVLINLAKLTDNIAEVPFIYSYDRKIGKSKMPLLKTLFDYLRFIAIRLFHSSP
jgi:dolichol-phosphate mannosyltransferase